MFSKNDYVMIRERGYSRLGVIFEDQLNVDLVSICEGNDSRILSSNNVQLVEKYKSQKVILVESLVKIYRSYLDMCEYETDDNLRAYYRNKVVETISFFMSKINDNRILLEDKEISNFLSEIRSRFSDEELREILQEVNAPKWAKNLAAGTMMGTAAMAPNVAKSITPPEAHFMNPPVEVSSSLPKYVEKPVQTPQPRYHSTVTHIPDTAPVKPVEVPKDNKTVSLGHEGYMSFQKGETPQDRLGRMERYEKQMKLFPDNHVDRQEEVSNEIDRLRSQMGMSQREIEDPKSPDQDLSQSRQLAYSPAPTLRPQYMPRTQKPEPKEIKQGDLIHPEQKGVQIGDDLNAGLPLRHPGSGIDFNEWKPKVGDPLVNINGHMVPEKFVQHPNLDLQYSRGPITDKTAQYVSNKIGEINSKNYAGRRSTSFRKGLEDLVFSVEDAAKEYNLDPNFILSILDQESSLGRHVLGAVQSDGDYAVGIAQYMKKTANSLKLNRQDPVASIYATAMQAAGQLDRGWTLEDTARHHFAGTNKAGWKEDTAHYGPEVVARAAYFKDNGMMDNLKAQAIEKRKSRNLEGE